MRAPLDSLTPREREVLVLIGRGLTNEEIADRLGISLDGAKYHVSQILSKLGAATREEAAAVAISERRRWWAAWPLWAKIAGTATIAAAVAGLAIVAWGVLPTESTEELVRMELTDTPPPRSLNYDRTILGRLVAIDGHGIVVLGFFADAEERFVVEITGDTLITKDGVTASATDLRLGDTLSALVADSNDGKFIAASIHVRVPENVAGVTTPGPICIEDMTDGNAIQPDLAQTSIRQVFHGLLGNETWVLNYGENEPQVDNSCPLPLPTLPADRVGVPEMLLIPAYVRPQAASAYRWFVYIVSEEQLNRLIGQTGIQFTNQEEWCPDDLCSPLSYRIFISASQLRDVVALTNVFECFAVGQCTP